MHDQRLAHFLGDEAMALIADPRTCELSVNPDGGMFVTQAGSTLQEYVGQRPAALTEAFICSVAHSIGEVIDDDSPSLSAELPPHDPWRGARFQAQLPRAAKAPMFSLRFHAREVYTLESYVERGIMTAAQATEVTQVLLDNENFMLAGATFSGKTTLFNALLHKIAVLHPKHRQALIEDTYEVQLTSRNFVQMHTHGKLTMQSLLRDALRLAPNGVFVGEVRGETAQTMLEGLGTGHYGGCTIHAPTTLGALRKLEDYIRQSGNEPDRRRIAESINLVIAMKKDETHPAKRLVTEVSRISPMLSPEGEYKFERIS